MIETYSQTKTLSQLLDMKEQLNFSLAIQRAEDLWNQEQKSLLIHSILYGYPVPAVWSVETNNSMYNIIDGKQRLTNLFKFIENNYELHEDIPEIDGEKIAGLKFEQLSEKLQKRLLNSSITINFLKNITEDEIEEFFRRINNGVSLTQIQINRVLASTKVMEFIKEIASMPFFKEVAEISDSMRKKSADEELIMQIISLIVNEEPTGFTSAEIRELAKKLRIIGISEEYKELIRKTTDYLYKAIPEKQKGKNKPTKKVHIPMLFSCAITAQEKGIEPNKFGGWVQRFFETRNYNINKYSSYCITKTANKTNVVGRLREMKKDFDKNIDTAPYYKSQKSVKEIAK